MIFQSRSHCPCVKLGSIVAWVSIVGDVPAGDLRSVRGRKVFQHRFNLQRPGLGHKTFDDRREFSRGVEKLFESRMMKYKKTGLFVSDLPQSLGARRDSFCCRLKIWIKPLVLQLQPRL